MSGPRGAADLYRVDAELSWARDRLTLAGIDSPGSDAEWLLADALTVERGRLVLVDGLDEVQRSRFRAAVEQRAQRIPLQHIVGTAAFGPGELAVGPGVFVPRPETEFLAEWAQAQTRTTVEPVIVDLCSGSGALAIALAVLVPAARVYAVERSPDALEWLRHNVAASDAVADRITVVDADVTDPAQMSAVGLDGTVDVVVANPPYVPLDAEVSPEVAHDPAEAVFGGVDGMAVIVPMMPIVASLLAPGGVVGVEHDDTTSAQVVAAIDGLGEFADVRAHRDLAGRPRFVTARRVPGVRDGRGRMAP
ncbi:peptide chain release factor N(5)-glutamine methyltransferase [Gordonia sp. CPCC 206044]|uniref:peptide chain release factor N(5)-glutamine methyltransferase n=1 Tax=Gordonia sp. CPCC 206044 TaxID=3140793 RepID=UPI003AF3C40A